MNCSKQWASGPTVSRRRWLQTITLGGLGIGALWLWGDGSRSPGRSVTLPEEFVVPPFDGQRAYRYLRAQCRLGPRPTGSVAIERLRRLLERHFQRLGLQVERQRFSVRHPRTGRRLPAANIVVRWAPERPQRVVLGAHYDTRPYADEDPKRPRYLGANDGASGVAALMEIAHHLNELPLRVGVDLVCFDAEEFVFGPTFGNQTHLYCLGSKHFALLYRRQRRYRYTAGVILDMVAGREAAFYPEQYSVEGAGWLVNRIWSIAAALEAQRFRWPSAGRRWRHSVYDDHVPLLEVGIPTIDIIDFDYPHWHRGSDRPEACSAATLDEVGKVVLSWLRLDYAPS